MVGPIQPPTTRLGRTLRSTGETIEGCVLMVGFALLYFAFGLLTLVPFALLAWLLS